MQLHETTKNIFCLKKNGFTYIYTYTVDLILHVHKYLHEMSLVYDVITKKMNNHAPYTTQKSGIDPPPPTCFVYTVADIICVAPDSGN